VKGHVDQFVYASIEDKWGESMGRPVNYQVSDVNAGPNEASGMAEISQLGVLTLPQAVALATAQNRLYQDQREALYTTGLNLRLTRHQFERRFFGIGGFGYAGNSEDEILSAEATVGVNHLLADGTEIGIALTGAWVDVLSGDLQGGLASILGVAIRKPLLRGSKREIVLEGLTQAERDVLYQVRFFNRFRKGLTVSVITEYYRTLQLLDIANNARHNTDYLEKLWKHSRLLYDRGQLSQVERDRINQEFLQAQNAALLAEKSYEQGLDLFKRTLALDPTLQFQLDSQELEKLKQSALTLPGIPDDTLLDASLARRLDLVNEADRILDAERKIAVAQDRLRAELNIVGAAGGASREVGNPRTLDPYGREGRLGLEFDLPFDRVAEENDYRAALLLRNQQQRRYEDLQDQIRLEVRQAYRKLEQAEKRFHIQSDQLSLALERRRVAELLLQFGRASTRRILEAQSDLVSAQNDRTDALVNFAVATLEFYRDTGELQVKPDGMWKL
jgi:outer membrane protein TolC